MLVEGHPIQFHGRGAKSIRNCLHSESSIATASAVFVLTSTTAPPFWVNDTNTTAATLLVNNDLDLVTQEPGCIGTCSDPSVFGTGLYWWEKSCATLSAIHDGYLILGETKEIFFTYVGKAPRYYGSFRNGVKTYASLPSHAATPPGALRISDTWYPDLLTMPQVVNFTHTFTDTHYDLQGCTGCSGAYFYSSDVAWAALHAGLVAPGGTATIYLHHLSSTWMYFYSCTMNGITSKHRVDESGTDAVYVSTTATGGPTLSPHKRISSMR